MQKTQLTSTHLDDTGPEISRVGFGAWAIIGAANLELSDDDVAALQRSS
jgi:hypothetical protein